MTIEEALVAHAVADAAIAAVVGTRVYSGERDQGAGLPAVAINEVSGESYQDMTSGSVGLAVRTFQFDCYGATTKAAVELRELVRVRYQNHINALMGASGSPLSGGVQVWACIHAGEMGGYEFETDNVVRSVVFDVHYQQPQS